MKDNFILISGRVGTGKTELVINYCNKFPKTTLLLSEENTEEMIKKEGLSDKVRVSGQKNFKEIDLLKFNCICIDWVELFDEDFLHDVIQKASEKNMHIIAITQMRSDCSVRNIFANHKKRYKAF